MRVLFRLLVFGLAAFGAKTLLGKVAPKAADLREPVGGAFDDAKFSPSRVVEEARRRVEFVHDPPVLAVSAG
jgi:hypothetical protein